RLSSPGRRRREGPRPLPRDRARLRPRGANARRRGRRLRRREDEEPRDPAVDGRTGPRRDQDEAAALVLGEGRRPDPRGVRPRARRGLPEGAMTARRALGLLLGGWLAALGASAAPSPARRTENV